MINVQFSEPELRIREEHGKHYFFDPIRKTWLLLTEEEWVRQCFVQYLINQMKYPASFIALEKEIWLNDLKKRFDLLVYNKMHQPWMLVECKAPDISLKENVLQQVLRYSITVPVEFIIITNGRQTMGWQKMKNELEQIEKIPLWMG